MIVRELDFVQPQELGTPNIVFPFRQNGDSTTVIITRHYKQTYAGWFSDQLANRFPVGALVDLETGGFLVEITRPQTTPTALLAYDRIYSRIPLPQVVPSSIQITKPVLPLQQADQVVGAYYVNRPNPAKESYDAYLVKDVSSDTGASVPYPTGGTYVLTFSGSSTGSLAYNASAATIQTALNALTPISNRGGVVVSGAYNDPDGVVVTFNNYAAGSMTSSLTPSSFSVFTTVANYGGYLQTFGGYGNQITGGTFTLTMFGQTTAAIAWNATTTDVATALGLLSEVANRGGVTVSFPNGGVMAGTVASGGVWPFTLVVNFVNPDFTYTNALAPSGAAIAVTPIAYAYRNIQGIVFSSISASARTLGIIGHGFVSTDTIFVYDGSNYYAGIAGNLVILDANNIQILIAADAPYATVPLITQAGKRSRAAYKPGSTLLRCLKTTAFYLPGITPGIPDIASIPIPENQSDPDTFLQAVFAGSGTLNWQVGDLTQWEGWPILQQITTTLDIEDI